MSHVGSLAAVLACAAIVIQLATGAAGIGCYVCSSSNGDNPFCEDSFNTTHRYGNGSAVLVDYYKPECLTARKERQGSFPATVCVKLKGTYWNSDRTLLVRTCSLDSSSLTMDTELSRIEHSCGIFDFQPDLHNPQKLDRMVGCIEVCSDADGCNAAGSDKSSVVSLAVILFALLKVS